MFLKSFQEKFKDKIDQKIQKIMDDGINEAYFEELKEILEYLKSFVLRPGKRIRPLLVILGYYGYSDKNLEEDVILTVAAGIEIMHAFLLIHDDIMDRALERRGAPAMHILLQKRFENLVNNDRIGEDLAIVLGDIAMFYVIKSLASLDIPDKNIFMKRFSDCYIKTAYGQILDSLYTLRNNISEKDVGIFEQIAKYKTAYYTFFYPLVIGLILSGKYTEEEEKKLEKAIIPAGIAFQIRDDIISSFDENSGKSSDTDFLEGKFTSLIELAIKKVDRSFFEILSKPQKSYEDVTLLKEKIIYSGAIQKAKEVISYLCGVSLENLKYINMKHEYREILEELVSAIQR
ncbi:polyprenyl synthetase family protein [Thermosipho ferrireducens]|uniref:Polyprenyl synthetase family protein n=1 Tax=Thermosipho ferrireducens TaxID=2571116 RepID=A0ABX7S4J7_9BACT|nr:polyprenyl synthetase family protein [Thermosipho ferrireducens]QTA37332.1 polyprenyl synthetase family protein [Thermosipho ferrireducens]